MAVQWSDGHLSLVVKHLEGSNLFTKVLDGLEGLVERGVVPGTLILSACLLRVAKQQLLVITPSRVDLLL